MHSLKKENQNLLAKVNLNTPNQIKSYVRSYISQLYYVTQVNQDMKTFLFKIFKKRGE